MTDLSDTQDDGPAPLDAAEICDLARFALAHGVTRLEWENGQSRLRLKLKSRPNLLGSGRAGKAPVEADPVTETILTAPCFGVVVDAPEGACGAGRPVAAGDVLAFVKLGPALRAIRAPGDGAVTSRMVEAGRIVGFGDPVFGFRPGKKAM